VNDANLLPQQLSSQVRRGVDQHVPLRQTYHGGTSQALVAGMAAGANSTGTTDGRYADRRTSSQENELATNICTGWFHGGLAPCIFSYLGGLVGDRVSPEPWQIRVGMTTGGERGIGIRVSVRGSYWRARGLAVRCCFPRVGSAAGGKSLAKIRCQGVGSPNVARTGCRQRRNAVAGHAGELSPACFRRAT
jgi:hypothetical protein